MTEILITGGTGYLARAMVRELLAARNISRIFIYSRNEASQAAMRAELGDPVECRWLIGDVRDLPRLSRAMQSVKYVVHTAALKRVEVGEYCPDELVKTNVIGTMNVIDAAIATGVQKVVAVSTDKACDPINAYGSSKLLAEKLVLSANALSGATGPRFAVVRYGNVWGSTGSIVPRWRALLAAGAKTVPVTDLDCTRFYMTAQQAVRLVLDTLDRMSGGELNIPNLPAYRVGDLAIAIGADVDVIGLPPSEKKHECMLSGESSEHAPRMSLDDLRGALAGG